MFLRFMIDLRSAAEAQNKHVVKLLRPGETSTGQRKQILIFLGSQRAAKTHHLPSDVGSVNSKISRKSLFR